MECRYFDVNICMKTAKTDFINFGADTADPIIDSYVKMVLATFLFDQPSSNTNIDLDLKMKNDFSKTYGTNCVCVDAKEKTLN